MGYIILQSGNPYESFTNPFRILTNPLQTLSESLRILYKPFPNPYESFTNPFQILTNPLQTLYKPLTKLVVLAHCAEKSATTTIISTTVTIWATT